MLYILLIIVLILIALGEVIFFKMSKLKDFKSSIDMCLSNIEDILNHKIELVNELLTDLNNDKLKQGFTYNEEMDIYEKEDSLFEVAFNINKFVKDNNMLKEKKKTKSKTTSKSKKKSDESSLSDNIRELNVLEEGLDGLKDFYNTNVLNYNEIFLKKGFNKLYRLLKFKDYKSFKIRKLEEYEIFKN